MKKKKTDTIMKVGLHETTWGDPLGRRLLIYGAELGGGERKTSRSQAVNKATDFDARTS